VTFLGDSLRVEINMQVRSMGPISEMDMVREREIEIKRKREKEREIDK
jgi:hypothetical protein